MQKFFLSAALLLGLTAGQSGIAEETPFIGVVNFATCLSDSKAGKKEQESMEQMRKHLVERIEDTDKELREMVAKFEDPEYLDSLSPKAEEELKSKFQARQEDLSRYQNQFYQMMNQMQMAMYQKVNGTIVKAAKKVAEEQHLDYVMNKDACFYIRPDFDVTQQVIVEMDKSFDLDAKAEHLGENAEIETVDEMTADQAG